LISEGEFDALAALQAGHLRTVSVPDGAGSNLDFLEGIWDLLKPVGRSILGGDADEPGRKLNAELAPALRHCSMLVAGVRRGLQGLERCAA
jgi:twinkle protein